MKRIISVLLSVIFIVFLAGCNQTVNDEISTESNRDHVETQSNVSNQNDLPAAESYKNSDNGKNPEASTGSSESQNNVSKESNITDTFSDKTPNYDGGSSANSDSDKIHSDISKRNNIPFKDNQLYAIAYAGYQEMNPLEKYSEYLDTFDLPCHYISDGEYYIIIPRYDDMDLKLYRIDTDTDEKTLFYQTPGCKPFIVQCNASDICNDAFIELNYKNRKTGFSPYISLKDGGLQANGDGYIIDDLK